MMVLYIKLGTMPGVHMQVIGKRSPVKVGDVIQVREVSRNQRTGEWQQKSGEKATRARCDAIRGLLYFMECI